MREILAGLPAASLVLDLGSGGGSFDAAPFPFTVVRADIEAPGVCPNNFVMCSAAALPFRNHAFQAVISNHSLEHFEDLDGSLREIGRVIDSSGALFVAVPDATTFTDRLYRWLARGGGHVNPFNSAPELASKIERLTGLRHAATSALCTSLSFLNRKNLRSRTPKRLMLMGAGTEISLLLLNCFFRMSDRLFGTRASVYGWAFYFGNVGIPIDCGIRTNVCIRCGSGHPSGWLRSQHRIVRRFRLLTMYRCPACDTWNLFTDDAQYSHLARTN
jgi:SAM-dependent methyltransferase